jgi:hypothetical protein
MLSVTLTNCPRTALARDGVYAADGAAAGAPWVALDEFSLLEQAMTIVDTQIEQ